MSEKRLALTFNGNIRYQLKTPYRDGTTHVIFEPLDFIAKLAALIPKPRTNLTRFHGVFAPNSKPSCSGDAGEAGQGTQAASTDRGELAGQDARRAPPVDDLDAKAETGI